MPTQTLKRAVWIHHQKIAWRAGPGLNLAVLIGISGYLNLVQPPTAPLRRRSKLSTQLRMERMNHPNSSLPTIGIRRG